MALYGLQTIIGKKYPCSGSNKFKAPNVIFYADDLVILHEDIKIVESCKEITSEWLKQMGLELKPNKTRITHTLNVKDGEPGFDFLGFNVRQYLAGKTKSSKNGRGYLNGFKTFIKPSKAAIKRHTQKLHGIIKKHQNSDQEEVIKALNPVIIGWTNYYSTVNSANVFKNLSTVNYEMLRAWAIRRHPTKNKYWIARKYWRVDDGKGWIFQPSNSNTKLYQHTKTHIRSYVKVQGSRSPYDGNWLYWSIRLGRHPEISKRVAILLKRQQGKCLACKLFFRTEDVVEVDHIIPKEHGGLDVYNNFQLLHRHCHDTKTASDAELGRCV